jgi:hypothetical protein
LVAIEQKSFVFHLKNAFFLEPAVINFHLLMYVLRLVFDPRVKTIKSKRLELLDLNFRLVLEVDI